jgi:hypothetical protein
LTTRHSAPTDIAGHANRIVTISSQYLSIFSVLQKTLAISINLFLLQEAPKQPAQPNTAHIAKSNRRRSLALPHRLCDPSQSSSVSSGLLPGLKAAGWGAASGKKNPLPMQKVSFSPPNVSVTLAGLYNNSSKNVK